MKLLYLLFFIGSTFALLEKRGPQNAWGKAEINGLFQIRDLMALPAYNIKLFPYNDDNKNKYPFGAQTKYNNKRWVVNTVCAGYYDYNQIYLDISAALNSNDIPDLSDPTKYSDNFLAALQISFQDAQTFFAASLRGRNGLPNPDPGHLAVANAIRTIVNTVTTWNTAVCAEEQRRLKRQ